jgi:uncharacterized delta-60 repeat protein
VGKLWLVSTVGVLAVSAMIGAGVAEARLDPSFGGNGVVEVQPQLPAPWQDQYIRSMAATRGGDSFVFFERRYCAGQGGCLTGNNLLRYLDDGSLDSSFGGSGGSYELPREGEGIPTLAVDSRGRPLLAQASAGHVVVRRLTSSGAPDLSFGGDGAVAFDCSCEYGQTQLLPGPGGMVTVSLPRLRRGELQGGGYGRTGTIFTLVRLEADGSTDRRFGHGGSTTFGLRGVESPVSSATAVGGALYLGGGAGCCGSPVPGYVIRVSAKGRLDGRFTTASQRSLRSLERLNSLEDTVEAVLVRPGGKIDLLGSAGYEKGFLLRLNPNGHVNRKLGGLRVLPFPVASAALGSDGATLAASDENLEGVDILMRILAGGRLDPRFGREGARIPLSDGDSGLSVVSQTGRKAMVLDLGLKECRGFCLPEPKLVRFLEGPPPKRR